VIVSLLTPQWDRSCKDCQKYFYDNDTGAVRLDRVGLPMLQVPGIPSTPCHKCEKVPLEVRKRRTDIKAMRQAAAELTAQHRQAWAFYRKCRTIGRFPSDPLVEHFAVIFRDAESAAERMPILKLQQTLELMVQTLPPRRQ